MWRYLITFPYGSQIPTLWKKGLNEVLQFSRELETLHSKNTTYFDDAVYGSSNNLARSKLIEKTE